MIRDGVYVMPSQKVLASNHAVRTLLRLYAVDTVAQFKVEVKLDPKTRSGLIVTSRSNYKEG